MENLARNEFPLFMTILATKVLWARMDSNHRHHP
jgi:hypothetical protein